MILLKNTHESQFLTYDVLRRVCSMLFLLVLAKGDNDLLRFFLSKAATKEGKKTLKCQIEDLNIWPGILLRILNIVVKADAQ